MALEWTTAEWMDTLHNNALELRNFEHFIAALWKCFEDPIANHKAKDHIKTISQGCRGVAEYTSSSAT